MRVITGSAKGTVLIAPKGKDIARPTTDRVKEGIFSAIQFEVAHKKVLDLFAGSGQLGIEALSRGAQSCVFVDNHKESLQCIRQNLEKTNLREKAKIVTSDVLTYLRKTKETFDFVFLDPPYMSKEYVWILNELGDMLTPNGKIFCESDKNQQFDKVDKRLTIKKQYQYGTVMVTLFTAGEEVL